MARGNIPSAIFRSWVWWLSDDIFVGIQDSFAYSRNIDVRSNGQAITISKAFVSDYTPDEAVNAIIRLSNGDVAAFWEHWKIYKKTWSTRSSVTTDTPDESIISACEFNGYIYWTQPDQLHRVKLSDWGGNLTGNEEIWFQGLKSSNYHPLLVSSGSMFVWNKDQYDEVDINNVYKSITTPETWSTIMFMDDLGGNIRVTTRSEIGINKLYLITIADKFADQIIPLYWAWVKNIKVFEWYTYVITEAWVTALDGYKLFKLKEVPDASDYANAIAIHKDYLVFGGEWAIYTRWQKNKNYAQVLVSERVTSNNKTDDQIRAICSTGKDLYVSWSNGTDYGIDILTDGKWNKWELITRAYFWENLHSVKEWVSVDFWFQELLQWQEIKLSYSTNGGAYKDIITLQHWEDRKVAWTETKQIIDQFQYIQFKIELLWWATFYSIDFRFNIINT